MLPTQEKTWIMIKSFTLLVVSFTAIAYVYQYGRSVNQTNYRSFSVTGEGTATTIFDTAQFSASVITDGGIDVAQIQKQNTEKMNKLIEFIKNKDIDAKDIKTKQYTLNPQYDYPVCLPGKPCPSAKIIGYNMTQSVAIKVRDMEKVGTLVSGVIENGANSVSGISFVVDDETKAKNNAREEAISQGKKQAISVARASGFSLGKLISVYEDTGNNDMPSPAAYDMSSSASESKHMTPSVPSIEPGSSEQKIKMVLTYEIR